MSVTTDNTDAKEQALAALEQAADTPEQFADDAISQTTATPSVQAPEKQVAPPVSGATDLKDESEPDTETTEDEPAKEDEKAGASPEVEAKEEVKEEVATPPAPEPTTPPKPDPAQETQRQAAITAAKIASDDIVRRASAISQRHEQAQARVNELRDKFNTDGWTYEDQEEHAALKSTLAKLQSDYASAETEFAFNQEVLAQPDLIRCRDGFKWAAEHDLLKGVMPDPGDSAVVQEAKATARRTIVIQCQKIATGKDPFAPVTKPAAPKPVARAPIGQLKPGGSKPPAKPVAKPAFSEAERNALKEAGCHYILQGVK